MAKRNLKRDDEVVMLAGKDRGKRGRILKFLPKKNRVIVEGLNLIKKHIKKNQQNPEGAIAEREGSVHISNVAPVPEHAARESSDEG